LPGALRDPQRIFFLGSPVFLPQTAADFQESRRGCLTLGAECGIVADENGEKF
jgi:hypothetical protein